MKQIYFLFYLLLQTKFGTMIKYIFANGVGLWINNTWFLIKVL